MNAPDTRCAHAPDPRRAHAALALLGLRASGKSTVGRALAAELGCNFVDLDEAIVADVRADRARPELAQVRHAGDLLARLGEHAFRDLEEQALAAILARTTPLVLATGGGVVERAAARAGLIGRALCVWLECDTSTLLERLRRDPTPRPALTSLDPAEEIEMLRHRRAPYYRALALLSVRTDLAERDAGATDPVAIARAIGARLDPSALPLFRAR